MHIIKSRIHSYMHTMIYNYAKMHVLVGITQRRICKKKKLFWFVLATLHHVQDLSSPIRYQTHAVEAWSLYHWAAREVPQNRYFQCTKSDLSYLSICPF